MLPAKIKGLNEDSSDESADEEEERRCNRITKEALEQNTQQIYREALKLQKQNNFLEAERLLQQLLDNDLLTQAEGKVKYVNNRIQPSLVYLKYCCYLNLGNILSRQGEYVKSLDKYIAATELDDTDLNLWYRMGNVAVKIPNYLLAIRAFNQALKRNARHWPSLESIIDATYATGDTMSCLCYINHSLNLDPSYVKGRVLKKRILRKHPFLAKDYGVFFSNNAAVEPVAFVRGYDRKEMTTEQRLEDEQQDETIPESLQKEIDQLDDHIMRTKRSQNVASVFDAYLENKTWSSLADLLLRLYNHLNVADPIKFFNKILITTDRNGIGDRMSASTTTQDKLSGVFVDHATDATSIDDRESETDHMMECDGGVATASADIEKPVAASDKETIDSSCKTTTTTTIRKRKSSPTLADQLKICDKRRSTRNKTVLKNNEPSLSKILHNFIPADLLPTKDDNCANTNGIHSDTLLRWSEDSFDTMDIYRLLFEYQEENDIPSFPVNDLSDDTRTKLLTDERYFDTDKENADVEWFVKMYGSDELHVLQLFDSYCKAVSAKWRYTWPKKLTDKFLRMARILSKHNFRNDRLDAFRQYGKDDGDVESMDVDCGEIDANDKRKEKLHGVEEEANFLLMYNELLLNERYDNSNEAKQQTNTDCENILGDEFNTLSLGDLRDACYQLRDYNINRKLWIRCVWLRALIFVQREDTFAACSALSSLINDTWWLSSDENVEIRVPNMLQFHSISVAGATRLLNTLQRNKNLDEVRLYFASKRYDRVAEILEDTLKPSGKRLMRLSNENTMPRHCQYELLMASLWQSKNYKELFKWCEVCSYEAFTIYRKSFFDDTDSATKSKWAALLSNALRVMLSCIQIAGIVQSGDTLKADNLSRLVQTLTNLICHQIESSEPCAEIVADCVTPWLLLANFIDYYAKKQSPVEDVDDENEANSSAGGGDGSLDACPISPALSLLFTAHEFLGRRSWCCFDDGALLFYTLNVIEPIWSRCGSDCDASDIYSQTRATLSQQVDQIFYCLYSHPFKKNKPRHVQEHNSLGLALTWSRAAQAYAFYRPSSLPQFDAASKLCTISADTETLFKRIVPLVPDEQNPSRFLESINQYLGGSIERIPPLHDNKNECKFAAQEVADLYYLLGDYYFKNKIMAKAIKYYLFDICWNSSRFDSWAAMALARGSQLEMKFNSCETISNEQEILNKAELTGKCFETALQLDRNQSSLWIEYGVFSYAIHAFCSRLLKQETTNLSLQMFDTLESRKNSFLQTSRYCFNSANKAWIEQTFKQEEIQDERWLNHYMLGKINEKIEEKPTVYLAHYHKASKLLDANGAEYPTRVIYSSPQYYSVEALEIHYRIHASILKILDTHEEKTLDDSTLNTFNEYLATMARSPFGKIQARSTKCNEGVAASSSVSVPLKNEKSKETNRNSGVKKTSPRDADADEVAECLSRLINEVAAVAGSTTTSTAGKRKADATDADDSLVTLEQDVPASKKIRTDDKYCRPSETIQPSQIDDKGTPREDGNDVDTNEAHAQIVAVDSNANTSRPSDIVSPSPCVETETRIIHASDVNGSQRCEGVIRRKSLVRSCVKALEECIRRFPEHYKSYYRLSSHYFRSKSERDIEKARKYLIETGGLFADRTSKNFFGGIWRIPTGEIDRAGSFCFHMSRSVHLLMDVLRDTRDYKTLLHLSDQLKIKPDLDKKYIRDNEREQLCREASSLSGQTLRMIVESMSSCDTEENKRRLLMDVYKCYHRLSKNSTTHKDTIFGKLLVAVYQKYTNREDKVNFDQILAFCKSLNYIPKMIPQSVGATPSPPPPPATATTTTATMLGEARYDFAKSIPQIMNLMMGDKKTATSIASSASPYLNVSTNDVVSFSQFKPKLSKSTARPGNNFPSLSSIGGNCSISVTASQSSSSSSSSSISPSPISWHKSCVGKSTTAPARGDEEKEKGGKGGRALASFDCGVVSISAVPPSSSHKKLMSNASASLQSTDIESSSIHRSDNIIIGGKERPNLVITPVLSNPSGNESASRPTLQQKLAAKQMSNVAATATGSSALLKSFTSAARNSIISVTPPPITSVEVSKQLALASSSAISIFPVNRTTSSTASKFAGIPAATIVSPSVTANSVAALPADDSVHCSQSHAEHSSVGGRTASETFAATKTNKMDFKFINASSGVIIEPAKKMANRMSSPTASAYANELRTKDLLKSLDNNPDLEVIPKNISNV